MTSPTRCDHLQGQFFSSHSNPTMSTTSRSCSCKNLSSHRARYSIPYFSDRPKETSRQKICRRRKFPAADHSLHLTLVFPTEVEGGQLGIGEEATALHLRLIFPLSNARHMRADRCTCRVIPMLAESTFAKRFPVDDDKFHDRSSRTSLAFPQSVNFLPHPNEYNDAN